MSGPHRAYIGLGSNLQDPVLQVRAGLAALAALSDTTLDARSSLYRSDPVGLREQPRFVNAVARLGTALAPVALLELMLAIERRHGRTRAGARGGPRTLDLDLLLYDGLVLDMAGLTLPHPRLHERAFVLYPLAELQPALVVPGRGRVRELARLCAGQGVQRFR